MKRINRFVEILSYGGIDKEDIYEHIDLNVCNEAYNILIDELNNLLFKPEKIAKKIREDIISHNYFAEICEHWCAYLKIAYEEKLFDTRNQESCRIGNIISKNDVFYNIDRECNLFEDTREEDEYSLDEYLVLKLIKEHRTIQQTFSSLAFYYLYTYGRLSVKEALKNLIDGNILNEEFWKLPLI